MVGQNSVAGKFFIPASILILTMHEFSFYKEDKIKKSAR